MTGVGIIGSGSYVPEKVLTNADLEKMVDTNDEWIRTRTGIHERRISADDESSSDLAYEASIRAIDSAGLTTEDIDMIIVATITPDMFFPSTACILQERLGINNIPALDISAACSGFLYGLSMATPYIQTSMYRHILVVGSECLSKIVDWEDRNTCVLFGDGAGAVVLGPVDEESGFLAFEIGADGSGGEHLQVPAGGSKQPATLDSVQNGQHYLKMHGREVFKFAVRVMEQVSESVIEKANLAKEDISLLVPHQANWRIIDAARKRLELDESQVIMNLDRFGNMSSASIPVALDEACRNGNISSGDHVVLVGFGAGLTWGGSVIRWQ